MLIWLILAAGLTRQGASEVLRGLSLPQLAACISSIASYCSIPHANTANDGAGVAEPPGDEALSEGLLRQCRPSGQLGLLQGTQQPADKHTCYCSVPCLTTPLRWFAYSPSAGEFRPLLSAPTDVSNHCNVSGAFPQCVRPWQIMSHKLLLPWSLRLSQKCRH